MEIKVINQRKIQLIENHKVILELQYGKWWSNNAEFRYLGKQFEIKAKGFWQNNFIITENRREIGMIKLNYKQDSIINLKSKDKSDKQLHFAQESIWHSKFMVQSSGNDILRIHAKNNWKKFHPDFSLKIENDDTSVDLNLVTAISIYLINNRLKSAAAGASIAAVS
ncbi:hypothetical protein [Zunongwangia sp. HRR-M8]|uniref:hypothetical protein n=1 Tax=Zunongwangia sp. HRR-M8 TaxID=3015170 RepID=UPI0022DE281D|nr:hypothetical protein [Zunongwangia sp. HRR-M8]WBL22563.1 hypothetical protein PBT89_01065 [Zunongwangia sp. HRR-M8]